LCRLMEGHALAAEGFASAEEFLAAVREDRPGCLVLDLRLPGMNGLALQDQLSERDIALPIIFISACGTVATAVQAVKSGAIDFLTKPLNETAVVQRVQRAVMDDTRRRQEREVARSAAARLQHLTNREREVLSLVVQGRTNKDIASRLAISTKTVEAHRAKVMRKTGAANLVELVRLVEAAASPSGSSRWKKS